MSVQTSFNYKPERWLCGVILEDLQLLLFVFFLFRVWVCGEGENEKDKNTTKGLITQFKQSRKAVRAAAFFLRGFETRN
jgi:hypothetical protein